MKGMIFDIKEMAVHDGPGVRTTVFLKGCPLRCKWCHNPEGLMMSPQLMFRESRCCHCGNCMKPCAHSECAPYGRCIYACPKNCLEISGRSVSAEKLAEEIIPTADFMGTFFGGFTFSGGEPLYQSDFLLELIGLLKKYHLCIETSGYAEAKVFSQVVDKLDSVIMDIKFAESEEHQKYTGVGNSVILENFSYLKSSGKPYIIRTPMIPGITDTEKNLSGIKRIIGDSSWEMIPYNPLAGAKYKMLGMKYRLEQKTC